LVEGKRFCCRRKAFYYEIAEFDNIRWGVAAARKGGLTKEMTWNAMGLNKIEQC